LFAGQPMKGPAMTDLVIVISEAIRRTGNVSLDVPNHKG
jgi:hypothetical protein